MRRGFGQSLRVGVANTGMALVKASRWGGTRIEVLAEHPFAPGEGAGARQVGEGMRALFDGAGYARWPVRFVLADELARLWQVSPPPASTRLADLEAAAALRFQMLYGEPASGWSIAANWDAGQGFVAAALPRATLDAIAQAALDHKLAVVEIVPQFIAAWNRCCAQVPQGAWYGLVHDGVLTLGVPQGSSMGAVRTAPVPAGAGAAWLEAHVAREALRLNMSVPDRLQLSGQVPAAWHGGTAALQCALLDESGGLPPLAALAATGSRA
ncbi:MAG: hypothetical protein ACXW2U_13280 [Telluria sp.]